MKWNFEVPYVLHLVNGLSQEIVPKLRILRKIGFYVPKKRILTICTPSDPNSRRRQDPILRFPPFPLKTSFRKIVIAKCYEQFLIFCIILAKIHYAQGLRLIYGLRR